MATPTNPIHWTIQAVFDDGDHTGFLYTIGRGAIELFVRDVQRADVKLVAGFVNFLGQRPLKDGELCKKDDDHCYKLKLHGREASNSLHENTTCQMAKKSRVMELVHDGCHVEKKDGMVLLCRRLPSGRVISIDTMDGHMLNGGTGIAHLNFDNGDNRVENLEYVGEIEARKLLCGFEE